MAKPDDVRLPADYPLVAAAVQRLQCAPCCGSLTMTEGQRWLIDT